jgi:diadenosine tetraphosphate (Ap4A) HIT family hydrolase
VTKTVPTMTGFELDPRLVADTVPVGDMALSRVLLMNDSRFPWLVLVPRKNNCTELYDLTPDEQNSLMAEITRAAQIVRSVFSAEKINVGALGNIVAQLHIHIVGRHPDDPAWPNPVWGSGRADPYSLAQRIALAKRLAVELGTSAIPVT